MGLFSRLVSKFSRALRASAPAKPRSFSADVREACWNNAPKVIGRSGDRWRLDANGNPVLKALNGKHGGPNDQSNCQIIQTGANRSKSNRILRKDQMKGLSRTMNWTHPHLDTIEIAVYASVERDDLSCTCPTIDNLSDANFKKNICELPEFMTEEGIHCLQVADAMSRFMSNPLNEITCAADASTPNNLTASGTSRVAEKICPG
uniref:OSJNBa0044K18.12 protein n=1 Tax=Oryza sativa subsp. japonica TaxID=39947 RepID=Q7XK33_ORYSJ|nr:OSJNBa0044K18.12 [Oryza sativa Japonica Group]